MIKSQIIILCNELMPVGGIETFTYNFVKAFKDTHQIAVVVENAFSDIQRSRLTRMCPTYKANAADFECDVLICNNIFSDTVPSNIKYKRKIQMLHATKLNPKWKIPKGADTLVAVSEHALDSFSNEYIDADNVEVINNMTSMEKPQKVLKLISVTSLSPEKGGERIVKLAELLNKRNIPFLWTVFTNKTDYNKNITDKLSNMRGMAVLGPVPNGRDYIPGNDYLVQLSDAESYCYSIIEALELKVPVITTPIGPLEEIGFKDGVHGHVIPFDITDDCIDKILKPVPKFTWDSKNDAIIEKWETVLNLPTKKTKYSYIEAECISRYFDIQKAVTCEVGDRYPLEKERFKELKEKGFVKEVK